MKHTLAIVPVLLIVLSAYVAAQVPATDLTKQVSREDRVKAARSQWSPVRVQPPRGYDAAAVAPDNQGSQIRLAQGTSNPYAPLGAGNQSPLTAPGASGASVGPYTGAGNSSSFPYGGPRGYRGGADPYQMPQGSSGGLSNPMASQPGFGGTNSGMYGSPSPGAYGQGLTAPYASLPSGGLGPLRSDGPADRVSVPNAMFGELFNTGSSDLNFAVRVQVQPKFAGSTTVTAATLQAGITQPIAGVQVTALDSFADLVEMGRNGRIDGADIAPIDAITVGTDDNLDPLSIVDRRFTPVAPISNDRAFAVANSLVERELFASSGGSINLQQLVQVRYLADQSSLDVRGNYYQSVSTAGAVTTTTTGQIGQTGQIDSSSLSYVYQLTGALPVPSPGQAIGRYVIADNFSPMPQDRIFLDYSYFDNARLSSFGTSVNRWSPGIEKTFLRGMGSFEFRLPMARTLSSDLTTTAVDSKSFEIGDLALATKFLLSYGPRSAWSVGTGFTFPTADDFQLSLRDSTTVVQIENESFHILPYTAFYYLPTPNTFFQVLAQFDGDITGNRVLIDEDALLGGTGGPGLREAGRLFDQPTFRFSTSTGAYLMRRPYATFSSLSAVIETHYTTTLADADAVGPASLSIRNANSDIDMLNMTTGIHAEFQRLQASVGYGFPVSNDRVFDGELRMIVTRTF